MRVCMRLAASRVLLILGLLLASVEAHGMLTVADGVWDVSVLMEGSQPLPPSLVVRVAGDRIEVSPRSESYAESMLGALAAALRLIPTHVPAGTHGSACGYTPGDRIHMEMRLEEDGVIVNNESTVGVHFRSRSRHWPALVKQRYSPSVPLPGVGTLDGAALWALRALQVQTLSADRLVVQSLIEATGGTGGRRECSVALECMRRHSGGETKEGPTSARGPIVLLLCVVCVRFLPRYFLTKTGQLNRESYRGVSQRAAVSAARRMELMKQQEDIITQMKAEDAAMSKGAQRR